MAVAQAGILRPDLAVGCRVQLETVLGEEVAGEVFAIDGSAQCLVVKQPGGSPQQDCFRIIALDAIRSSSVQAAPPEGGVPPLPEVDLQRCRGREDKALRWAVAEAAKIGVDVTREAQQIFDALAKTLPCRWDGQVIVVLEEIFIHEPYGPEDCRTTHPEDVAAMRRVKKVLTEERKRLGHGQAGS